MRAQQMSKKRQTDHARIRNRLLELLEPAFPGVEVEVGHAERWNRTMLTIRHGAFADLLAEQRFRRVVQLVPPEFFEELQGCVWFELAPAETHEDLMKAPRSEDVARQEPKLVRKLIAKNYFEKLKEAVGDSPIESCGGDFKVARRVLDALGLSEDQQRDACLVFIRNEAYCDCEVLLAARPALLERYGKP